MRCYHLLATVSCSSGFTFESERGLFVFIYLFLPFFLCLALFCSNEALWQVIYNSWKQKQAWFHLCSEAIRRKCCGVKIVILNSWFTQHFSHVLTLKNSESESTCLFKMYSDVLMNQELEFSFSIFKHFFVRLESFNELRIPTLATFKATDKHAPHIWGSSVPQFHHDNIIVPLQQVLMETSQLTATLYYVNVFFSCSNLKFKNPILAVTLRGVPCNTPVLTSNLLH